MDTEENEIKGLDAEELASLARQYYNTRFPNPQRHGCPSPGEIMKVVSQRRAPDQALRDHLFECSECFGEYRQALAQRQPAPEEVRWMRRLASLAASKRLALASVILVFLSFFLIGGLIWRESASEPAGGQIARSTSPDARADGAGRPDPNRITAPSAATVAKPPVERRAMRAASRSSRSDAEPIEVDLDSYLVFRRSSRGEPAAADKELSGREGAEPPRAPDVAPQGEKIISLPATRVSLVLRLPETGVRGKYNVSLVNAYGRPLLSSSAFSHDGVEIRVTLDLRQVPPQKYRLRLRRKREAPAFYNVVIGER